jgi:hypothetical protein
MYHLFVSGSGESWQGEPWQIEISRCVREYTDPAITAAFGELTHVHVETLRRYPCVFAYEAVHRRDPKFGLIRNVTVRQGEARIEYELHAVNPFLTAEQMEKLTFELDISNWELNRTHWAVEDVDLASFCRETQFSL